MGYGNQSGAGGFPPRALYDLRLRLEQRRPEIERALLARVYGVADPTEVDDLAYIEGFRAATAAAFDFALATIESPGGAPPPVPPPLLSQARLAARHGVGLDTVLRRYTAGHSLFIDFLLEEVDRGPNPAGCDLRGLLAACSSALDGLLASVSEEHAEERMRRRRVPQQRRRERVDRLLAGEPLDAKGLNYDLEVFHVGAAGRGLEVEKAIRALATKLDLRVLVVPREDDEVWGWFGSIRPIDPTALGHLIEMTKTLVTEGDAIAFGEVAKGRQGWRFTHRQAVAALPRLLRSPSSACRYADVGLIASVEKDELLCESLRQIYVNPLAAGSDSGEGLREALRAYLASERNISAAAAALDLNRQTVRNRLRTVESRIGRRIHECAGELEIALKLGETVGANRRG